MEFVIEKGDMGIALFKSSSVFPVSNIAPIHIAQIPLRGNLIRSTKGQNLKPL